MKDSIVFYNEENGWNLKGTIGYLTCPNNIKISQIYIVQFEIFHFSLFVKIVDCSLFTLLHCTFCHFKMFGVIDTKNISQKYVPHFDYIDAQL